MVGVIGLFMLIGITVLIAISNQKNSADTSRTSEFYQRHALVPVSEIPAEIFKAIGAEKIYCRQGNLKTVAGQDVPLLWCEWVRQSTVLTGNSRTVVNDYYLATAFLPQTISEKFKQKAAAYMQESSRNFSQKITDSFVLNTKKPVAVNQLNNGIFVIWWRAKKLANDYEQTFTWLQNSLSNLQNVELTNLVQKETPEKKLDKLLPAIQRLPLKQFLESMCAEDYSKTLDILSVTDFAISDYHDTKGHPAVSVADYANYLSMTLEEATIANAAITEIDFPVDEFLAKGFQIPELIHYEYQLAYRLKFPTQTLIYLDKAQLFLTDSAPLIVYSRS